MRHIFNQKCTVNESNHADKWGNPVDPTTKTYSCRIEEEKKVITNDHGEEVTSIAEILFHGQVGIKTHDEIEWADQNGDKQKSTPEKISTIKSSSRVRMTVVYV
ncbi:hypothetical protein [Chengkuizengella axinellae]|uniref:Uncharacterized protein n=1 Tax=Chengkuizengella axinellae TaxID=3064388 RepID=A0ABT9J019_9BACL|nr:hypothetical protein [Chengkuizengella sp. 2205SS18-9]MDP5274350.1 hypothetical protein [Chengkuizengella sp. 2205SS18-9]